MRQADYEFLYALCLDPEVVFRWRYRGAFPDAADFARSMVNGVLVQFIVQKKGSSEPVGLVTAYNANHREGWVYVAGLSAPSQFHTGLVLEGVRALVSYLFLVWPLRKIYFESIEFNTKAFSNIPEKLLIEEGRLKDHVFYAGKYWDLVTFATYARDWSEFSAQHPDEWVNTNDPASNLHIERIRTSDHDVLQLEDFCILLAQEISTKLPRCDYGPGDRLVADLGFDSLSLMELADLIDELAGSTRLSRVLSF